MTHLYFFVLDVIALAAAAGNSGLIPKGNYVLDQSDGHVSVFASGWLGSGDSISQLYAGLLARTEELMRTFR